jgi:hypothetical protein
LLLRIDSDLGFNDVKTFTFTVRVACHSSCQVFDAMHADLYLCIVAPACKYYVSLALSFEKDEVTRDLQVSPGSKFLLLVQAKSPDGDIDL